MANQKKTTVEIMQNRVNGIIKSFDSFKTSLRNNKEQVTPEQFKKMMDYLKENVDKSTLELQKIYETDDSFKL